MKYQLLLSLLFVSSVSTVFANTSSFLLTSAEVAAGRNLRNNGTQFCEVTLAASDSHHTKATAIITLPKGARLLDARVKQPSVAVSRCNKTRAASSTNTVQCELSRLVSNRRITLVARYHQHIRTAGTCSGYIKAGSRR